MGQAHFHWVGHVERWKRSGLTVREFCRREGFPVNTFYTWRKRYKKKIEKPAGGFVEITPHRAEKRDSEEKGDYPIEISAGAFTVRVRGDADSLLLENLFTALEARVCS